MPKTKKPEYCDGKCLENLGNCKMGIAKQCGHSTSSDGVEWCMPCAGGRGVCEVCGKPLKRKGGFKTFNSKKKK